jgi:superfamily II DNA/RNA helicase
MTKAFEKFDIDENFLPFFEESGFIKPTVVQNKVIPMMVEGASSLVVAQTGTGKTLSFAIPMVELVARYEAENGMNTKKATPLCVVLSPTRELAVQIHDVFKDIAHHMKIRARNLVASMGKKDEGILTRSSFDILVSTPNKLKKLVESGGIKLDQVGMFVIDEADQLLDLGFSKDMDFILGKLSDYTTLGLFSATYSKNVEEFNESKLQKFQLKKVTFKDAHKLQSRVETFNMFISEEEKLSLLGSFIERTMYGRGIIFTNRKTDVETVVNYIKEHFPKTKISTIHGDMSGKDRARNHKSFKDGKTQVLVATDIAARGIDIKNLAWVLNFGLPKNPEYYLHRCGRTARAGKSGQVYNFISARDSKWLPIINNAISKQSALDVDLIKKQLTKKKKKKVKKKKSKRVKITKRTRF